MALKKVLIVDGDIGFTRSLSTELEKRNYSCKVLDEGIRVLEELEKEYELILLDLKLPDIDGVVLCREIRKRSEIPIIVITEKQEVINKVLALDSGADDYMVKPINNLELIARINALFRRIDLAVTLDSDETVEIGDFTINKIGRTIVLNGQEINLTGKEFDLFYVLIKNAGTVFSREELLELVWGEDYYGDGRTIDVHIRRIRRKLSRVKKDQVYILTKWGVGYYFNPLEGK